jgi:phosphohistidine phosphatase
METEYQNKSSTTMKTLILMRHAKSTWTHEIKDDRDRPLAKRGQKDISAIGHLFKEEKLMPQVMLLSPAARVRQTADLLVDKIGFQGDEYILNSLFMGEVDAYVKELRRVPDEAEVVLVIGHNPSLEGLLQMLTGEVQSMPSAGTACLAVEIDTWKEFSGNCPAKLICFWKPKEL